MNRCKCFLKSRWVAFLLFTAVLPISSCHLGRRAPKLSSAGFAPGVVDGSNVVPPAFSGQSLTVAYCYSDIFILQYARKGNYVRQQGVMSYYLQIIEAATGQKLLAKPYKTKMMIDVLYNDGVNVWLQSMDTKKGRRGLAIFDVLGGKMRFTASELDALNPGIMLDGSNCIFLDSANNKVACAATDGQYYWVDALTGKCQLAEEDSEQRLSGNSAGGNMGSNEPSNLAPSPSAGTNLNASSAQVRSFYTPLLLSQLRSHVDDYALSGQIREQVVKRGSATLRSKERFLEGGLVLSRPAFATVEPNYLMGDQKYVFVCSKITKDNPKDLLLTMLRKSDLSQVWTLALPVLEQQDAPVLNAYHAPVFNLHRDTLYVVNSSYLIKVDVEAGRVTDKYALF